MAQPFTPKGALTAEQLATLRATSVRQGEMAHGRLGRLTAQQLATLRATSVRQGEMAHGRLGRLTAQQLAALRATVVRQDETATETFAGRPAESGAGIPLAEAQPDAAFFERMRCRAATRKEADARRGVFSKDNDNLAELQAETTARARAMEEALPPHEGMQSPNTGRQVGAALAHGVRVAAGLRVNHLKIQKADVGPIDRETDASAWYARIRAVCFVPGRKGPRFASIMQVARAMIFLERARAMGFVWGTYKALAKVAGCCSRTVERCMRFFEAHNLVDTLNVLFRRTDGALQRDANIYVPTIDRPRAPLPVDVENAGPVRSMVKSRVLSGLSRLAALFRLRERPWGLNATPISPARLFFGARLAALGPDTS